MRMVLPYNKKKKLHPLLSVLFLIYWGCEDKVEKTCTDVMALKKSYQKTYNTNDSCEIIGEPWMKEIYEGIHFSNEPLQLGQPASYGVLVDNIYYSYTRRTDNLTNQSYYVLAYSYDINDSNGVYSFYTIGDTLFQYRNQNTCYSIYQTNLEIRYAQDSLVWCSPSTNETPQYDTLFYPCRDYPSAYTPQCWDIDNPF